MAFEFIKKYFPIKTKSLESFIELVERERGVSVTAKLTIELYKFSVFIATTASYKYFTQLRSETPTGRPIVFNEIFECGRDIDPEERGLYTLKGLLTVDARLQRVRQRLPNIKTALVGPRGATLDEAMRNRMYEDARKDNVAIFQESL